MGVWADYEDARSGGSLDAYTFLRGRIGAAGFSVNAFGDRDLRADALGHILVHELNSTSDRIDVIVREIQLQVSADPGWLAKRFFTLRFNGNREWAREAGRTAVGDPLWTASPINRLFLNRRPPGAEGTGAPSATVRATEADAVGRAFADSLIAAQTEWALRS